LVEASGRETAEDAPTTRARQEPPFGPNLLHQIKRCRRWREQSLCIWASFEISRVYSENKTLSVSSQYRAIKQGNNCGGWEDAIKKTPTQARKPIIRRGASSSHKTMARC